jgi:hypothetical protein
VSHRFSLWNITRLSRAVVGDSLIAAIGHQMSILLEPDGWFCVSLQYDQR